MARARERTGSEIHSFSHGAIMTRATERTDSEMHSFSHGAIMPSKVRIGLNRSSARV